MLFNMILSEVVVEQLHIPRTQAPCSLNLQFLSHTKCEVGMVDTEPPNPSPI